MTPWLAPLAARDAIDIALLVVALVYSADVAGLLERARGVTRVRRLSIRRRLAMLVVGCVACAGCVLIGAVFHEPVPRIHDEFMHLVLSNTLAKGRIATPPPPLPEFFDTFHVLQRPVYASKAFPAQGAFLAVGERLTGHPIVGVWLSSALAVAATCWMLQAWIGPAWALVGGLLMVVQVGVFSYWSQSYWGGMVGALGGALLLGAARRLWQRVSATSASLFSVGLVLIILSRPLEGPLAALPAAVLLGYRLWRQEWWREHAFWRRLAPAAAIIIAAIATMAVYDRAITGSVWKPPYALHEEQYQESPPAAFMALRPKIIYSSEWLRYYYEVQEMKLYTSKRTLGPWLQAASSTLTEWWVFYCGVLLSAPLVLPVLLRRNWMAYVQGLLLAGWVGVLLARASWPVGSCYAFDALGVLQVALLWMALDGLWPRLALGIVAVLLSAHFDRSPGSEKGPYVANPAYPRSSGAPAHGRNAMAAYQDTYCSAILNEEFCVPVEFRASSPAEGFATTQAFVNSFGELLLSWPDAWQAARDRVPIC